MLSTACGAAILATRLSASQPIPRQPTLVAGNLSLTFHFGENGVALSSIRNTSSGIEYLTAPSPIFRVADASSKAFALQSADLLESEHRLEISGVANNVSFGFALKIDALPNENAVRCQLSLTNRGSSQLSLRVTAPYIENLREQGQHQPLMAAIPQEAAGVVTTGDPKTSLGMSVNHDIGLPTAMNIIELLSLYDQDGSGGVFFADADSDLDLGIAPVQLTFRQQAVAGHVLADLAPGETKELPAFLIGVHDHGDWHEAVDKYLAHHESHWHFPETPAWLRDQGAIYSFSGSGAGSIYMEFPQQDLASRISSFEQLPNLLAEAQQLGTNILYLWDFWEGTKQGGRPAYWNKGDYIPRSDLGGSAALKSGIEKVHQQGGRIILYLEPFIIFRYSQCGEKTGEQWAARDPAGALYHQYPQNYSMVSCFRPWQDFIIDKACTLVKEYGVDGIYLDSWGWQMNWPMKTAAENLTYSPLQVNLGVLDLAKRLRAAIRAIRPDAIVIGETTSGALGRYWDGGLSADFAWLAPQNQSQILGSPARYAMPQVNIFSNGRNRNELNQVFAAGYHLALLNANLPDRDYIRTLVQIRQQYKDALIHGQQISQPKTTNSSVVAYYYRGSSNHLITVVNIGSDPYSGPISLAGVSVSSTKWKNLLSSETLSSPTGRLQIELAAHSLLVLAAD